MADQAELWQSTTTNGTAWSRIKQFEATSYACTGVVYPTGKIYAFYIYLNGAQYDIKMISSTDTVGVTWGTAAAIVSDVENAAIGCDVNKEGNLLLIYHKDDSGTVKKYLATLTIAGVVLATVEVTT